MQETSIGSHEMQSLALRKRCQIAQLFVFSEAGEPCRCKNRGLYEKGTAWTALFMKLEIELRT